MLSFKLVFKEAQGDQWLKTSFFKALLLYPSESRRVFKV